MFRSLAAIGVALLCAAPCHAQQYKNLFNGQDLTGWEGDPALWSVEEGAITGRTTDEAPLEYNKFLIWRGGVLRNFELRAEVRLIGNSNSGIQYRSQQMPDAGEFVVGGYQCDIHPTAANNGMLYDERGRGIVAQHGQRVIIDTDGQKWLVGQTGPVREHQLDQWHEYTIVARGNRMVHRIDGQVTAVIIDHQQAERELEGILAFQVHRGPAMKVQFRNIRLRELPAGGLLSPDEAPVPEGAKPAGPPPRARGGAGAAGPRRRQPPAPASDAAAPSGDQAAAAPRARRQQPSFRTPTPPPADAVREPEATAPGTLKVADGFHVELLYSVPAETQGSWVNMTVDPRGRLIVSDQYGKLYRVTPPALGDSSPPRIEPIAVDIGEAQGLLWAFDSLYVMVNTGGNYASGLYRVRDTNADGDLDHVELLRALDGGGEHGPHAILLAPDGQGLYLVCGNGTQLTTLDSSRVPLIWGEDHLLPRMPDGRGFMRGVLAPGGCIYRVDPDAQHWQLVANGFRNEYDAAFNLDGELFAYDADMEWDMNTPWYRPTRVCHVVSGAEFGWRNGTGKWPVAYPDSVPPVVNIGPGSPTGVVFGYGARFPAKYQQALYICDWSYGKLYAVHLTPSGASYTGQLEEFITGTPLPLTDLVINPHDGAMYFAIGGRKTKSGLYRVTYTGGESTAPAQRDQRFAAARAARRRLESFHVRQAPEAVDLAWQYLGDDDRFLRYAARVTLEHQPVAWWRERALAERDPQAALTALLALVRTSATDPLHRTENTPAVDPVLRARLLDALDRLAWQQLSDQQRVELVRTYAVLLVRMGPPDEAQRQRLIARFAPHLPSRVLALDSELVQMLVYLQAPTAARTVMAMLGAAPTQEEQIDYVKSLRMLDVGWTGELREEYFRWFLKAGGYRGGASFGLFVDHIKEEAVARLSDAEHIALQPILDAQPERGTPIPVGPPRQFVREWTIDDLAPHLADGLAERDFDRGRTLFGAANCFSCHRYDNQGGAMGPDLTGVAGRFSPRDLLESIVNPSKEVSDQYAAVTIVTADGEVVTGRIVNLAGDTYRVNTNMLDPDAMVGVDVRRIELMEPSKVSMMPQGLLNTLEQDEVLDLLAYLLSRGDRQHPMFSANRGRVTSSAR